MRVASAFNKSYESRLLSLEGLLLYARFFYWLSKVNKGEAQRRGSLDLRVRSSSFARNIGSNLIMQKIRHARWLYSKQDFNESHKYYAKIGDSFDLSRSNTIYASSVISLWLSSFILYVLQTSSIKF